MCGISGRYNLNGLAVDPQELVDMNRSLIHRGPDGGAIFANGPIGLAHRRLSVIDLSERASQPMSNREKTHCIVFNGEIYNYLDLKDQLAGQGSPFYTDSDTEVLLRAYQVWGIHCLQRLRGMFAFAIWDALKQTLFMARDRIGIKPLYYFQHQDFLIFASEIKAILQSPDVPREVAPSGVFNYFTFGHSIGPSTIFSQIKKLLPGHYLLCRPSEVKIEKYWDLDHLKEKNLSESETIEQLRGLIQDSVQSHRVSDVPLGAFLSGGLDSSTIVAHMAHFSEKPIETFSIGFDVGGRFNELQDAKIMARQFGTQHHERVVHERDVQPWIERLVYHFDEPFADAANLPTLILSEFASQRVKVVLTGEGGDEILGGYRRYVADECFKYVQGILSLLGDPLLLKLKQRLKKYRRISTMFEAYREKEPALRYSRWLTLFSDETKEQLLNDLNGGCSEVCSPFQNYYDRVKHWSSMNRMLYMDLKLWLPDTYLEKVDKATMAFGLEGRLPFLDHSLVEFAFTIPGPLKIRGGQLKYLLKKSVKPLLPRQILEKPKHGFSVPLDDWFRGGLKNFFCEVLFDERVQQRGYLRRPAIETIFKAHLEHQGDFGIQLWALLNFELWCRQFLDVPAGARA